MTCPISPYRTYPVSADQIMRLDDAAVECLVRALGDRLRVCDPFDAANDAWEWAVQDHGADC